jgi:hypothetical protein
VRDGTSAVGEADTAFQAHPLVNRLTLALAASETSVLGAIAVAHDRLHLHGLIRIFPSKTAARAKNDDTGETEH